MLVLTIQSGNPDDFVVIGENIIIHVLEQSENRVRIGIEAPKDIPIVRHLAKDQEAI